MRRFNLKMLIIGLTLLLTLACATTAWAMSAEIVVDSTSLAVGDSMALSVNISGSASAIPPRFKTIDGLQIDYRGPTTSVQMINGKISASTIFNYSVVAIKAGNYTIGPVTVKAGKQTLSTNRVQLTVSAASSGNVQQPNQNQANEPNGSIAQQLKKRLYLTTSLPRKTFFVGESVKTTIRLYVGDVSVKDISYPKLKAADSCQVEIGKPIESNQTINGISYKVVDFPTTLNFIKTGKFDLGPATMQCTVMVQRRDSDSLFGDFFNDYEESPQTLISNPLQAEVLALPAKPAGFSGGIGVFSLEVAATPQEVLEGDPITVLFKVKGSGNLAAIAPPVLTSRNGLKIYEAQRKNAKNTAAAADQAIFEQILFPLNTQVSKIGPFTLTFFNPAKGDYQTITSEALPVKVKHNPNFNPQALGQSSEDSENDQLGQGLVYIKDTPGNLTRRGTELYRQIWFWLLQLLPFGFIGAAFGYRRYQEFHSSDTPQLRALRADRKADSQLISAKQLLEAAEYDQFLDELHRIFREFLAAKFHLPSGGITGAVTQELKTLGIAPATLQDIEAFFATYDQSRFTGMKITQADAERLLELVKNTLTALNHKKNPSQSDKAVNS